ncbi:probable disease resistance protein RPP1 isoform X1 [Arabidopsis lyrata subsp. lyrata]|uniref:probable disease resistance protein RPP1 isoform X1 n=1 Tax=Arabidopsis lyrata subsp. lyrata TaxID=81972 RepID=UPI000A29C581|nr:probable disease resistance protein RPP1 isoform X1 [Arabidopsis lyrata subsp. lyrata]|eukprot:XP_020874571.1 probable disease resistance protein RPP1 isoform X1 [Arabidopsis lyrata subsp. lyrata]
MDSSFYFGFCAAAITFFTLFGTIFFMFYGKHKSHQENKTIASSPSSSSTLSFSSTPSSLSQNRKHEVFPSFHGADVRKTFLAHILKEFKGKGIVPFIDNDIERSKSIGPELIEAIKRSKIAIVLLSRNYASSSWCLNELVEIMKCREELGQTVMTIFYDVNPTDVKKQTGDFGKVFKKTCKGKTKEDIKRWQNVLEAVATIAGEHSRNWDNEAAMTEKIATDVSNMLNRYSPSRDFDGFIGMGAHMNEMESLLCLDSDEVRMIGIWGPSGIGKTTIARVLYSQFSENFELSIFMENIKELMYTRPVCSDEYSAKIQLQQQFLSQIINHKDMELPHLGVAQDRLNDKRVLIVLDSIDQSIQLDAIAKETRWFGHGSRIIITTQDQRLLKAHGINHIYKVEFPSAYEAYQIFCMYAFGQNFPKDGFEELAWQVTKLLGNLPLGLRVMGSHFRGMSRHEWVNALPRLKIRLDASIQSILKFSYDALCDEDKDLFLHIACLFNNEEMVKVEDYLALSFLDVRQGLHLLAEKSLIAIEILSTNHTRIKMHNLLVQLGRDIVRHKPGHQSIREPGKRQFLVDARDIREVLTDNTGNRNVIGIRFDVYNLSGKLNISERAFEGMSNLKFLRFYGPREGENDKLYLPQGLNNLPRKLRILEWSHFPMKCLPSNFCTKYLVQLCMGYSKLQNLWQGNQVLGNLKRMDLWESKHLKELPDLSTATNLEKLTLFGCSSLAELPSSLGNLQKLRMLNLRGCSKLEALPTNINLESLDDLDLADCLLIKSFPEISTNIKDLMLTYTAIKEVPSTIKSWSHLRNLEMSYNDNLKEFPHALDIITKLYFNDTEIQEIPLWVKKISRLQTLVLEGCKRLVTIPQLSDSLSNVTAINCQSLERLDFSFHNHPKILLWFINCFKLNNEAREFIQTSCTFAFLPGREVPANFTYRANGSSIMVNLNQRRPLSTTLRFKACVLLDKKVDNDKEEAAARVTVVFLSIREKGKIGVTVSWRPGYPFHVPPILREHLLIFEFEADVTCNELLFSYDIIGECGAVIKECGVLQL